MRGRGILWAKRVVVDATDTGKCRLERRKERVVEVLTGAGEANLAMVGIDAKARFEAMAKWFVDLGLRVVTGQILEIQPQVNE